MDWNSDGQWDLMSGDVTGCLNVYIRDGDELIAHEQYRLMDGSVLDVGANSFPAVFDWNGDGMRDLLVGSQDSVLRVYLNQASDTWPMFQEYQPVIAGDTTITFRHANPCIFDLDEDGRDDLIVGHYDGYVHFFRNIGDDTLTVFAAGESLRFEDGAPVRYGADWWWHSRCSFGDWNNDGTPDFLMTTRDGTCALFKGVLEVGVEAAPRVGVRVTDLPTVMCGSDLVRLGGRLFDVRGRQVTDRRQTPAPGVYFLEPDRAGSSHGTGAGKVVVTD